MKLHIKLALILTGSMIVLLAAAQVWQVDQQVRILRANAEDTIDRLATQERANARNVARAAEYAVTGSLERGEMDKFSRALDEQRHIEGLLEFSLIGQDGQIAYSTLAGRVGATIPDGVFERASMERQVIERDDRTLLVSPQAIAPDCLRCHLDWPREGFGGALYMEFSRDAVIQAREQVAATTNLARETAVRRGTLLVIALCLVLAGLIHIFLGRPLSRFIGMLDHFRTDPEDLTYRIDVKRRDEIGRLGETLNAFLEKVHSVVDQSAAASLKVHRNSSQIAKVNGAMSEQLSEQKSRTTQIAASTEEMAATSREVARQCTELQTLTTDAGSQAREGVEIVGQAVGSMRDLAVTVTGASELVVELEEHSRGIGSVVELIESIAAQTNLLALNATIEAARAGEHGLGFAVVAEEVRALAQRTQEATDTIGKSITKMNDVTQRSVEEMGKGAGVADDVLALAERAASTLGVIAEGVERVGTSVGSIAAAAEQQSSATGEIATTIDAIDTATRANDEGARESAEASKALLDDAQELQDQITIFRI
mgnify:CR=1 FL=1